MTFVQVEDGKACNGLVGGAQLVSPCLRLPEVLELLHHANQVSPVFAMEAVIGTCVCVCVCMYVCMCVCVCVCVCV